MTNDTTVKHASSPLMRMSFLAQVDLAVSLCSAFKPTPHRGKKSVGGPPPASPPRPAGGPAGTLENPGPASFQSGIGLLSGWVCAANVVELEIDGGARLAAAYGTTRADTAPVCGDTDNGFGLLFNWNLLGDGEHTVVAVVDGAELDRATVRVSTLGEEFVYDAAGRCVREDFPTPGETITLTWQEAQQNFVITGVE